MIPRKKLPAWKLKHKLKVDVVAVPAVQVVLQAEMQVQVVDNAAALPVTAVDNAEADPVANSRTIAKHQLLIINL